MHPLGVGGGGRAPSVPVPASVGRRGPASALGVEGEDVGEGPGPVGEAGRGGGSLDDAHAAANESVTMSPKRVRPTMTAA